MAYRRGLRGRLAADSRRRSGLGAREVATAEPPTFLERIALRMPDHSGPDEHREYLALLDRALLDRRLSGHERVGLVSLATELGIGRDKALELHQVYFDDIVGIAWEDGILSQDELADIVLVGGLLGVDAERITAATAFESRPVTPAPRGSRSVLPEALRLTPGDRIVLTGEMSRPRDEWIGDLAARGLVVWPGVTKRVRLVVAADPDSQSGKLEKHGTMTSPSSTKQGSFHCWRGELRPMLQRSSGQNRSVMTLC